MDLILDKIDFTNFNIPKPLTIDIIQYLIKENITIDYIYDILLMYNHTIKNLEYKNNINKQLIEDIIWVYSIANIFKNRTVINNFLEEGIN
jgi:hypothetical protein